MTNKINLNKKFNIEKALDETNEKILAEALRKYLNKDKNKN